MEALRERGGKPERNSERSFWIESSLDLEVFNFFSSFTFFRLPQIFFLLDFSRFFSPRLILPRRDDDADSLEVLTNPPDHQELEFLVK